MDGAPEFGGSRGRSEGPYQEGGADGESVGHLVFDGGVGAIGDFALDLEAADHGAGVHDEDVRSVGGDAFFGELVLLDVGSQVERKTGEAFLLNAEHHGDLMRAGGGLCQRMVEAAFDLDAWVQAEGVIGQKGFGAAEDDASAKARQQHGIRAGDAAVADVAGDDDGDALEAGLAGRCRVEAEAREHGAEVEQRLRGMLVHAVACIEDGKAGHTGEQVGSAAGVVAQDDGFGTESAEGDAGVLEGLSFFDGGGLVADEGRGRAEGFGCELEGGPGAGAGLVEQESDAPSGEEFGALCGRHALEARGRCEDRRDVSYGEVVDAQERAGVGKVFHCGGGSPVARDVRAYPGAEAQLIAPVLCQSLALAYLEAKAKQ
jgi:hypothetical protein